MLTRSPLLAALALAGACGNVRNNTPDAPAGGDAPGPAGRCDPAKPFGAPVLVENVNSSNDELGFTVTRDELTGFVGRIAQPPVSSATILVAQRSSMTASFTAPAGALTASLNNAPGEEAAPSSTADGLILYFHRQAGGTVSIFTAGRVDAQSTFSAGAAVTVDGALLTNAILPTISADGQTLYYVDFADAARVYAATRGAAPTAFTGRRVVSAIGVGSQPILSADERTMYYAQVNGVDVFVSTRASTTQPFGTGVPVGDVNSTMDDQPVALSHDNCVLYISSARSGGLGGRDIWQATRPR
jgi:hypothetical protein